VLTSDPLAVTLAARGSIGIGSELYHPGEDEAGGAIHTLQVTKQDCAE
jgi:hypothetical protein